MENYCAIAPEESPTAVEDLWKDIIEDRTPEECVQEMIAWSGADASCLNLLRTLYRACLLETRFPVHCGHTLPEIHAAGPDLDGYNFSGLDYTQESGSSRKAIRIGRNDRCPCGSGKKFKKCCMM